MNRPVCSGFCLSYVGVEQWASCSGSRLTGAGKECPLCKYASIARRGERQDEESAGLCGPSPWRWPSGLVWCLTLTPWRTQIFFVNFQSVSRIRLPNLNERIYWMGKNVGRKQRNVTSTSFKGFEMKIKPKTSFYSHFAVSPAAFLGRTPLFRGEYLSYHLSW